MSFIIFLQGQFSLNLRGGRSSAGRCWGGECWLALGVVSPPTQHHMKCRRWNTCTHRQRSWGGGRQASCNQLKDKTKMKKNQRTHNAHVDICGYIFWFQTASHLHVPLQNTASSLWCAPSYAAPQPALCHALCKINFARKKPTIF